MKNISVMQQQLANRPLFMHHNHLATAFAPLIDARKDAPRNEDVDNEEERDFATDRQPRVVARWYRHPEFSEVGVLPINDVIYHGETDYYWYGQSYRSIQTNMQAMHMDDSISVIAQVHNCYGGHAAACGTTATFLRQLREQSNKPVLALSDEAMYSASMYVASASDEIYVTPSAGGASIGTIINHIEISKMLEEDGVNFTAIRSGDRKARGGSLEELDEATEKEMHAEVTTLAEQFISFVAENQNVSPESVRALQGATKMGQEMVDEKLAKAVVETPQEFFQIAADKAKSTNRTTVFINQNQEQLMSDGKQPASPAGNDDSMQYTPEQIAKIEQDAENRLLAKQESKRKEAEAKQLREDKAKQDRENEILASDAAKANPTKAAQLVADEEYSASLAIKTLSMMEPEGKEEQSDYRKGLDNPANHTGLSHGAVEGGEQGGKDAEDKRLYGLVLGYAEGELGEDSAELASMKDYANTAMLEDKTLGTSISKLGATQ